MSQSVLGTVKGVYIDLETGGLDALVHGTTEVAMAAFEIDLPRGGNPAALRIPRTFQTYVKPTKWMAYSPGALAMQSRPGRQITLEFLEAYGKPEAQVVREMQRFLGASIYPDAKLWNAQMWAQNADFDYDFMSRMWERVHKEDPDCGPLFAVRPEGSSKTDWSCSRKFFTKLAAMIHKHNSQCGKFSQRHIMEFYGLKGAQTHTALQDCYDGINCLAKMFEDETSYYAALLGITP